MARDVCARRVVSAQTGHDNTANGDYTHKAPRWRRSGRQKRPLAPVCAEASRRQGRKTEWSSCGARHSRVFRLQVPYVSITPTLSDFSQFDELQRLTIVAYRVGNIRERHSIVSKSFRLQSGAPPPLTDTPAPETPPPRWMSPLVQRSPVCARTIPADPLPRGVAAECVYCPPLTPPSTTPGDETPTDLCLQRPRCKRHGPPTVRCMQSARTLTAPSSTSPLGGGRTTLLALVAAPSGHAAKAALCDPHRRALSHDGLRRPGKGL